MGPRCSTSPLPDHRTGPRNRGSAELMNATESHKQLMNNRTAPGRPGIPFRYKGNCSYRPSRPSLNRMHSNRGAAELMNAIKNNNNR
jgi:hypothetical protein